MFAVSGDPPAWNTHTSLIFKKNFRYYPQIFPRSSVSTVAYTTKMRYNIIYNITLFGESNRYFFWTTKMRYNIIIYTLFGESRRFFLDLFLQTFPRASRESLSALLRSPARGLTTTGGGNEYERRTWVSCTFCSDRKSASSTYCIMYTYLIRSRVHATCCHF